MIEDAVPKLLGVVSSLNISAAEMSSEWGPALFAYRPSELGNRFEFNHRKPHGASSAPSGRGQRVPDRSERLSHSCLSLLLQSSPLRIMRYRHPEANVDLIKAGKVTLDEDGGALLRNGGARLSELMWLHYRGLVSVRASPACCRANSECLAVDASALNSDNGC